MNKGLTNKEIKEMLDLLVKANTEQIIFIERQVNDEKRKREMQSIN